MACLAIAQHEQGWSPETMEAAIAAYLGMPPIAVREVATFYNMYNQQPVGRSSSTSAPTCRALRGGAKALDTLQETRHRPRRHADGKFTPAPSECLGACADAPVMLVNDRQMVTRMSTDDKIDCSTPLQRRNA